METPLKIHPFQHGLIENIVECKWKQHSADFAGQMGLIENIVECK